MKNELADLANLVTASHSALTHVRELRDAWQRGAIDERDHQGGMRSNRNADIEIALRSALAPYVAHAIHKMLCGYDWFQAAGIAGGDIVVYLKLRRGEKDPTLQKMIREGFDGLLVRAEYVGKVKPATHGRAR